MESRVMNKLFKNSPNKPVVEGWGFLASFLLAGPLGAAAYAVMHWSNVRKVLGNEKVKKYIIAECDKIYAKEKKKHKSLTPECPHGFIELFKKNPAILKHTTFGERMKNPSAGQFTVGKYTVVPFGDTDHIEKIVVILYEKDSDTYIGGVIPAPNKEDLKSVGLRKEEP